MLLLLVGTWTNERLMFLKTIGENQTYRLTIITVLSRPAGRASTLSGNAAADASVAAAAVECAVDAPATFRTRQAAVFP